MKKLISALSIMFLLSGCSMNTISSNVHVNETQAPVNYITKYVSDTEKVNLMVEPSNNSPALASIPENSPISFIENASNGYAKVVYNGVTGYVLASYLSDTKNTEVPAINNTTINNYESENKTINNYISGNDLQPESAPVNNAVTSKRTDLYKSSLTYKRMPNIHNSSLVGDAYYNSINTVIHDFDKQCQDYMNEVTNEVPPYLAKGTTAYNQQVQYKKNHPALNQIYTFVDVVNARYDGEYYYAWVTEDLDITENGKKKHTTDHWVYKLQNIGEGWYICDYTKDPAF